MKKVFFSFLLGLFILPAGLALAQSNTGFIPSNIWYSKDPFIEGDKIKIYTLVFNSDSRQMSGSVSFFDKNVLLGKKDFVVAGNSVKDISIDWTVSAGSHVIFAKIENAKFLVSPGKYETAYLERTETEESRRNVSKKAVAGSSEEVEPVSGISTDAQLQKLILENTPEFISKPITNAVEAVEEWRQKEADSETKTSFLFKNRYVFYGLILLVLFFTIRFVWHRIF